MEIYMRTKSGRYDAVAQFDVEANEVTVKKGSLVSPDVSPNFGGAETVEELRKNCVVDRILINDTTFSSPTMAACFVGGNSHHGYDDWQTEDGKPLRNTLLKEKDLISSCKRKHYTVRLRNRKNKIAAGTSKECAAQMGITLAAFYTLVSSSQTGRTKKYIIKKAPYISKSAYDKL